MGPTLIVLVGVMTMTGVSIGLDAFDGEQLWGELFEVPLMAAMFLAMVWHARRRVALLRVSPSSARRSGVPCSNGRSGSSMTPRTN